jgi:glycosyltransferase involved in cell wall biosynthesis
MRDPSVVLIHNRYQQAGGEDEVFAAEQALLTSRGHQVTTYVADNRDIVRMRRLALAPTAVWNSDAYRELRELCSRRAPVVAHFHNIFPLISPAAYYAARAEGAAVVQTLHNYRLICPGATLYRANKPCEACVGKAVAWPGILHACYRGDRTATTVSASVAAVHRVLGTWRREVSVYIAPTDFARCKFIDGGLPADRIVVKPNFLSSDPGIGEHRGGFALYVGRLSPEKGIETLLDAWGRIGARFPLKIAGAGPLERMRAQPGVEWLGWQPPRTVLALTKDATFLVLPSTCYEGALPLSLIQAFATGLPAIVSAHGSMADVPDSFSPCLFEPGNPEDLAGRIEWALSHQHELAEIGRQGRIEFERRYTAERNYDRLMQIYRRAIASMALSRSQALR